MLLVSNSGTMVLNQTWYTFGDIWVMSERMQLNIYNPKDKYLSSSKYQHWEGEEYDYRAAIFYLHYAYKSSKFVAKTQILTHQVSCGPRDSAFLTSYWCWRIDPSPWGTVWDQGCVPVLEDGYIVLGLLHKESSVFVILKKERFSHMSIGFDIFCVQFFYIKALKWHQKICIWRRLYSRQNMAFQKMSTS